MRKTAKRASDASKTDACQVSGAGVLNDGQLDGVTAGLQVSKSVDQASAKVLSDSDLHTVRGGDGVQFKEFTIKKPVDTATP